ncbi:MAG: DUF3362 domain-containing protein, partial [Gammaproteobacteria bacterium]
PMALATTMYHTRKDPLKRVRRESGGVETVRALRTRRLHKALLRYHDPANWPVIREALKRMGRADLIGNGKRHLVPEFQPGRPAGAGAAGSSAPQRRGPVPRGPAAPARGRRSRG